jgi:hypothetical protein
MALNHLNVMLSSGKHKSAASGRAFSTSPKRPQVPNLPKVTNIRLQIFK